MDYLDLVNKVIDESGKENKPLTYDTWESAEAGRRIYPRIKRLVREAWKMLQMKRNEWEFNSGEFVTTLNPKMKFVSGSAGFEPGAGSIWVGRQSGFTFTLLDITHDSTQDDWNEGEAYGQLEFYTESTVAPVIGEIFDETIDGYTLEYVGTGSYKILFGPGRVREPRWNTMQAKRPGHGYSSLVFVPWNQFLLGGLSYGNDASVPYYFSQDYMGDLVFYSQTLQPFTLSFVYDMSPQDLEYPDDIPEGLPTEYHDWIAWEALMNLARFDKDPDLYAYAQSMATVYRQRAERSLMPIVEWATSRYDR